LCLSVLNTLYFNKQYYHSYNPYIKKYFVNLVQKLGLKQITYIHFLGLGIEIKQNIMSRNIGDKVMVDYPQLFAPFVKFMKDGRAEDILKQIFVLRERDNGYKYLILREFVLRNSNEIIYFYSTSKILANRLKITSPCLSIIKWHYFIITLMDITKRILFYIILLTAPFVLLTKMLLERKVALGNENKKINRKIIYFHKPSHASMCEARLFREDILKTSECIHSGMFLPLSVEKTRYLRKRGGVVCEHSNHKTQITLFIKRLVLDYYKEFIPVFFVLSYNKFMTYSVLKGFTSAILHAVRIESFLENINVKLAYFELEYGVFPSIFTIIANRHNVKTMTALHATGGCVNQFASRSNTIINYYLVPGKYYNKYLLPNNPHTDCFCPVGMHEVESTSLKNKYDYAQFKKDGRKVLGVFSQYHWPFFPEYTRRNIPVFSESDARQIFFKYWQPFFEWAAKRDDIFLVFKGKPGAKQYSHSFLKEIMSILTDKTFLQDDYIPIDEIIKECDCTVSEGDSSMFYNSLALGVPSVGYDVRGDVVESILVPGKDLGNEITTRDGIPIIVGATRYNKYLVAKTPEELIANLTYILNHELPESVYDAVRRDHYANGVVDNMTDIRIRNLITGIISENDPV